MITKSVMNTDAKRWASKTSLMAAPPPSSPCSSIAASTSGAVRFSPSRLAFPEPW